MHRPATSPLQRIVGGGGLPGQALLRPRHGLGQPLLAYRSVIYVVHILIWDDLGGGGIDFLFQSLFSMIGDAADALHRMSHEIAKTSAEDMRVRPLQNDQRCRSMFVRAQEY